MKGIAAATLSVAFLVAGAAAGLAAPPATGQDHTSAAAAATAGARRHVSKGDPVGDRYTDALNILGANGYTGIENLASDGQNFTATALHDGNHRVSVVVDPSAGTVKANG